MQVILTNMETAFQNARLGGGYFLLLLLAIYLIYDANNVHVHWEESVTNYTNLKKNHWICSYALIITFVIVCNPIVIFIGAKFFAVIGEYTYITMLLPYGLVIPYGMVMLLDKSWEKNKKRVLIVSGIVLIGLAGSGYGLSSDRVLVENTNYVNNETKEIIAYVEQEIDDTEGMVVLASDVILEDIRRYSGNITVLYGKDLWTYGLDLGIMDTYVPELIDLYQAMQNPEECIGDIVEVSYMYGCQILIIDKYEDFEKQVGKYSLIEEFENYLLYKVEE